MSSEKTYSSKRCRNSLTHEPQCGFVGTVSYSDEQEPQVPPALINAFKKGAYQRHTPASQIVESDRGVMIALIEGRSVTDESAAYIIKQMAEDRGYLELFMELATKAPPEGCPQNGNSDSSPDFVV